MIVKSMVGQPSYEGSAASDDEICAHTAMNIHASAHAIFLNVILRPEKSITPLSLV